MRCLTTSVIPFLSSPARQKYSKQASSYRPGMSSVPSGYLPEFRGNDAQPGEAKIDLLHFSSSFNNTKDFWKGNWPFKEASLSIPKSQ
ncbi:MAG: hypothetical protein ABIQ31_01400 [Ferruginibacter sp.]